jgi:hypothetical protein
MRLTILDFFSLCTSFFWELRRPVSVEALERSNPSLLPCETLDLTFDFLCQCTLETLLLSRGISSAFSEGTVSCGRIGLR